MGVLQMLRAIVLLLIALSTPLLAMDKEPKDTYVLQVGKKGLSRMEFQHELLAEATEEHLAKGGSFEGANVLDLGCGPGIMTEKFARLVGPTGHVWAIDISDDQIEQAKERVKNAGLKNVTFIQSDAKTLENFPNIKFKVIYMGLLWSHINPQYHKDGLSHTKDRLEDDGIVLSVEAIMSTYYEPCNHDIFVQYRNATAVMGEKTGNDYDLGKRLKELYKEVGFSEVQGYFRQPTITAAQAIKLLSLEMPEWEAPAVKLGVFTQEQLNGWKRTIATWPEDDSQPFHTAKFAYVVARK